MEESDAASSRGGVAKVAEGLRLHLSSNSATGYKGVSKHKGRFQACKSSRTGSSFKKVTLGSYDTAVEAAVAYARHVGPPKVEVTDGLPLHRSSTNATGYMGVYPLNSGRFHAQARSDGKQVYLGSFGTAVEAAAAYTRHVGSTATDAGTSAAAAHEEEAPPETPREETATFDAGPPAPAPPPTTVATLPAAPVLAAVPAGETLRAKVDRIKASLELPLDLSVMAGIREANALMGLAPDGLSLPEQADRLLAQIG